MAAVQALSFQQLGKRPASEGGPYKSSGGHPFLREGEPGVCIRFWRWRSLVFLRV